MAWPPEALDFLSDLEANNDRDWFRANRERYDAHVAGPARALSAQLEDFGRPHHFRPYRDTRFHPGPPIKEQVAFALGHEGAGGFYVELSLDGVLLGAGLYDPASDQLDRYRQAVDDHRRAAALEQALAEAGGAGLALHEPDLRRAPRGYPIDHPRIDMLRRKRVVVMRREPVGPWLHEATCAQRIRTTLEATRPLVAWLREHVGPTQRPRS